jgi:hypothetical protein
MMVIVSALILINLPADAVDKFALPVGSTLRVRLGTSLSGKDAQTGDEFTGDAAEPIISGGEEVVPTGSAVAGKVFVVRQGGHAKGAAELRLAVESITTPAGARYSVSSTHDAGKSDGTAAKNSAKTEAGANKQSGSDAEPAPLSAVIAAATTTGVRGVLKKHQEIEVSPGTEIDFVAKRDVTLSKVATRQQ